jgi:hypothetical protein
MNPGSFGDGDLSAFKGIFTGRGPTYLAKSPAANLQGV